MVFLILNMFILIHRGFPTRGYSFHTFRRSGAMSTVDQNTTPKYYVPWNVAQLGCVVLHPEFFTIFFHCPSYICLSHPLFHVVWVWCFKIHSFILNELSSQFYYATNMKIKFLHYVSYCLIVLHTSK